MDPSSALRKARRALDGRSGVELLGDLDWFPDIGKFALQIKIAIDTPSPLVPACTHWYVLVSPRYPHGELILVPAKDGGLSRTFPHQTHNSLGPSHLPWRRGNVCVDVWGDRVIRGGRTEPFDGSRLTWRVDRLKAWLEAAASGRLFASGTSFELPHFPITSDIILGYCEDAETFGTWSVISDPQGVVELAVLGSARFARKFKNSKGTELLRPDIGKRLRTQSRVETAAWILLEKVLYLDPWHAPTTWGELRSLIPSDDLEKALTIARKNHCSLLLVGMPMPENFGQASVQVHWQGVVLPPLTTNRRIRGFRSSDRNLLSEDFRSGLADDVPLAWLRSENWSPAQLARRRALGTPISDKRVLLIGCGSLGSAVGELLVRAGVRRLTVVDGDVVTGGVLVRTSLSMDDIGDNKAVALARKLNSSVSYAEVNAVPRHFTREFSDARGISADIIVDCSAEDEVLRMITGSRLHAESPFLSFSLSWEAEHLFALKGTVRSFDPALAIASISHFSKGRGNNAYHELRSEGIGCFHPAFPADIDRIWRHASLAIPLVLQPDGAATGQSGTVFSLDGSSRALVENG